MKPEPKWLRDGVTLILSQYQESKESKVLCWVLKDELIRSYVAGAKCPCKMAFLYVLLLFARSFFLWKTTIVVWAYEYLWFLFFCVLNIKQNMSNKVIKVFKLCRTKKTYGKVCINQFEDLITILRYKPFFPSGVLV